MFEVVSNLKGDILIPHQCMNRLKDNDYILRLARQRFEGTC